MPITLATGAVQVSDNWEFTAQSNLKISVTSQPHSDVFNRFFPAYDKAFILPEEKEDESGFSACLALNKGPTHDELSRKYGPFCEVVFTATDPTDGVLVGGANLFAARFAKDDKRVTTGNLNYIFTSPQARGKGFFRPLLDATMDVMRSLFPMPTPALFLFVEQNDPYQMTAEAYARDTAHAGIDQFDRLMVWAKAGARVVDFKYVQPALSSQQEPDDTLIYALLNPIGDTLDPTILAEHLTRFFAISVLKGNPLGSNDTARQQLDQLARIKASGHQLALLDPTSLLHNRAHRPPAASLLSALRLQMETDNG